MMTSKDKTAVWKMLARKTVEEISHGAPLWTPGEKYDECLHAANMKCPNCESKP